MDEDSWHCWCECGGADGQRKRERQKGSWRLDSTTTLAGLRAYFSEGQGGKCVLVVGPRLGRVRAWEEAAKAGTAGRTGTEGCAGRAVWKPGGLRDKGKGRKEDVRGAEAPRGTGARPLGASHCCECTEQRTQSWSVADKNMSRTETIPLIT